LDLGSSQHTYKKVGEKEVKSPAIYMEWVKCLDEIQEGGNDVELLECMKDGKLDLTAGVSDRFAKKLSETIQLRMKKNRINSRARYSRAVILMLW